MADKFLSRPEVKQRALRVDLAPFNEGRRGVVVTAEAERLTYFTSDDAGRWTFETREHQTLESRSRHPADMLSFPWSRRQGVATTRDLAVVAFKRALKDEDGPALHLDVLRAAQGRTELLTLMPIRVPLGELGLEGVGVDLWAWIHQDTLMIVAQGWQRTLTGPLPGRSPEPTLVLLRARLDFSRISDLSQPESWKVTRLDRGGYDLDARFERGRVWVVHRRSAWAMRLARTGPGTVWFFDQNPFPGATELDVDMPPLVLVSCPFDTDQPTVVHDDIPAVEHPQIQSIEPPIFTGDRLKNVTVEMRGAEAMDGTYWRPTIAHAEKRLIWRFRETWAQSSIGDLTRSLPWTLQEVASAHWLVERGERAASFATLLALAPAHMVKFEQTQKGPVLTLVRESIWHGSVVAETYRIVPSGASETALFEGLSIIDIGHERVMQGAEGKAVFPPDQAQYEPYVIDETTSQPGGLRVRTAFGTSGGTTGTRNTLGALLVLHQEYGLGLMGYADGGDGGVRVVVAGRVEPVPPATPRQNLKQIPPDIVVGTAGPGRAFVEIAASGWIPTRLPGYAVPYNDVLRRAPAGGLPIDIALLLLEPLFLHFTPRSLGGGLQAQFDALPLANALASGDSAVLDTIAQPTLTLTQADADAIQASLVSTAEASGTTRSDGAAFPSRFTFAPGVAQAEVALDFTAGAEPPGGQSVTFTWTFTPPDDSGESVSSFGPSATSTQPFTFPVEGEWNVSLTATAADGTTSTASGRIDVAPTLWNLLWSPFTTIPSESVAFRSLTLSLMRYDVTYATAADGSRQSMTIAYGSSHTTEMRFLAGEAGQQGRIELGMPIVMSSSNGLLSAPASLVARFVSMRAPLRYERLFTPTVAASDRRSADLLSGRRYTRIDRASPGPTGAAASDVETVRRMDLSTDARNSSMMPNALSCKPINRGSVTRGNIELDLELTVGASAFIRIASVIVSLGLVAMLFGPIMAAVVAIVGIVLAVPLVILLAIALGLGLGELILTLTRDAMIAWATEEAEKGVDDSLDDIREALDAAHLMTYAGEGLAEALAIEAIRQAIVDGHGVQPPVHDTPEPAAPGERRKATGRERFREQFFETIVVGENRCRVLLRV